jgi:hypothetical protein
VKKMVFLFLAMALLMAARPVLATVGDVNGDGKVDMKDVALVAHSFGSTPSDPTWNEACDLNSDGVINMIDIAIVASHFG